MHYVLSNYPLSMPYRTALEERFGASLEYLVVSELRQSSMRSLFKRLFATKGNDLCVAIEDDSSRALLPVLRLLAAVTRVRRLQSIDDRFEMRAFGRVSALAAGTTLAHESLLAMLSMRRARAEMSALLRAERTAARVGAERRVAYLNCNLWFGVKAGGSVGHISGVVNALMDLDHSVDFYSAGGRLLVDDRAEHVPLNAPRMLSIPFETTYYRFDRACELQIARSFAKRRPGFIYQRMSVGNFTGVKLSRRFSVPLVLEYNGSEAWIAKNWGRPLRYHDAAVQAEDVCLRHAHVVVTVSDVLGKELESRGVERHRIVVYPNCIDPKLFDPEAYTHKDIESVRATMGFCSDDVVATFIGTFGQWHGVDVLAKAIRYLIDHDRDFMDLARLRFALVGDGIKMPVVRHTLAGAEQGPYVYLAGLVPQKEAPKYLAASDLLLSPHVKNPDGTAFFGSPTKLFEYLAMGRGIIASDLDQLGEILRPAVEIPGSGSSTLDAVTDDAVAALVPPGDVQRLVEAIKMLVGSPALRASLARNARALALAKYTWRHHTQAILDGLARACGSAS